MVVQLWPIRINLLRRFELLFPNDSRREAVFSVAALQLLLGQQSAQANTDVVE